MFGIGGVMLLFLLGFGMGYGIFVKLAEQAGINCIFIGFCRLFSWAIILYGMD